MNRLIKKWIIWWGSFSIALFPGFASAKAEEVSLEAYAAHFSLRLAGYGFLAIVGLLLIATLLRKPNEQIKQLLFVSVASLTAAVTVVLVGTTLYLNTISWSNGPVHWHADFEVWACGQELDLLDPQGRFSNKTGTPTRHEHNDKRLHIEGVLVNEEDATLSSLFAALGGRLTGNELVFPTNDHLATYQTGGTCPDGLPGFVQVFAYQTSPDGYYQQRPVDPSLHQIAAQSQVPPGDCIIVEFGLLVTKTDRLCRSYVVAEEIGELKGLRSDRAVGPGEE